MEGGANRTAIFFKIFKTFFLLYVEIELGIVLLTTRWDWWQSKTII